VNIGALLFSIHAIQSALPFGEGARPGRQSDEARIEAARAVELDSSQPEFKALQEQLNEK